MEIGAICCSLEAEAATVKDFSLSHFQSVQQLSEVEWNRHIPEANILMQYEQLALIEKEQAGQMEFRYVLVQNAGVPAGAMYFQVVLFEGAQLLNYFPEGTSVFNRIAKELSAKVINNISLKLLVSGNVFMTGENGFYFADSIDKATRAMVLRKAVNEIFKSDSSIKAVLVSDLYAPKTDFDSDFFKCGYNEIAVESDMSVKLRDEWHSMSDYMNALSSKYRVRAKKVYSLCDESSVFRKEISAEDVGLYENELYHLYMKVMAKVDFKLGELTKDYFRLQKQALPNNYKLFAYFMHGQMIGFISAFHIGRKVEVHYTGMDHELCKPIHLYQRMMYDMVEYGILNRAEHLHFGRTAPEIKSTIGATPSPMYGYLRHRNAPFNFLLMKPYTRNLKPQQYSLRNPYKA